MSEMFQVVAEAEYDASTDTVTPAERDVRLASAEHYVQTAFFPALPVAYGALALQAIDACNEGDEYRLIDVTGVNPQPRTAVDGQVAASNLVSVLRLDHMLDEESPWVEYDLDSDEYDDVDLNEITRLDEEMYGPNPR